MEFLLPNYFNTTTMIVVNNNTGTAENLLNRDPFYQYYTDGMDNDLTTSSIIITFGSTLPVSRIAMLDTNFKDFRIFYNGATANSFTFLNADTTTSIYTGNADANKYFRFTTVQCSSITIQCTKTFVANDEKLLGLFVLSDLKVSLTRTPSSKGFKPKKLPKQVVHTLSDGGTRIHNVSKKYQHSLKITHVPTALRQTLGTFYDTINEFNFCPFGTATSWDAIFYEAVWDGPDTFDELSDDASSSGYSGSISIKETPY